MKEVEVQNYSKRHINAKISFSSGGPLWKFTGFYWHPGPYKRHEAWTLLRHLKTMETIPWVCGGDFNEILEASEKVRGVGRTPSLMEAFKNTLEEYELHKLSYKGPKFTWCNFRDGNEFILRRDWTG
jgi:hypothetical protein